jgi:RNA polymerase sigma-70 factor (ECF subfamily)
MRRVALGDLSAFEEIVLRHQNRAWAVAWRSLGDSAEAQDVVQEAFLRVLRAAPRYRPVAPFRTYLFQIVARLCLDVRAKKRPDYVGDLPEVAAQSQTPEESLQLQERMLAVRRALGRLPARHRVAIALRHEEGLSYDEIARVLAISTKAVDSLLQRARESLKRHLEDLL